MNDITKIKDNTKAYTALFVEDDEKSRLELYDLLTLFFRKVYIAKNGQDGLDMYNKYANSIDIVFTDIQMPIMSGFDMIKSIRDINFLQYIVVVSANQDLDTYKTLVKLGVNDILIKPIITNNIVDILQKAIMNIKKLKQINHPLNSNQIDKNHNFFIDDLTNLKNKNKLDTLLNNNMLHQLILVNIDNFDSINCKYGYKTADEILVQIADLFNLLVNESCSLFRVVSDEFAFLFTQNSTEDVELFAKKIIINLDRFKIKTDVNDFNLSCTIGIGHGSGEDIIRKAHIAIKETRQIGKDKYGFYLNNSQLDQKRTNNLKWLYKIKEALKTDTIIPYYQPILNNTTKKVEQYEALARILEMNRVIKPSYFIENAKHFQLMPNITKVMISKIFETMKNNRYKVCINITYDDLCDKSFIAFVFEELRKYKINPSLIIFEILETISILADEMVIENITKLTNKGFKISIDDFGTNNSNLLNLHRLKIDYIKIDGLYIEDILINKKSENIVDTIIQYAKSLNAEIIAESVSSKEIFEKVKSMGIQYSQGYFIGKPSESF